MFASNYRDPKMLIFKKNCHVMFKECLVADDNGECAVLADFKIWWMQSLHLQSFASVNSVEEIPHHNLNFIIYLCSVCLSLHACDSSFICMSITEAKSLLETEKQLGDFG